MLLGKAYLTFLSSWLLLVVGLFCLEDSLGKIKVEKMGLFSSEFVDNTMIGVIAALFVQGLNQYIQCNI